MSRRDRERDERERLRRARAESAKLPAGLDDSGRDERIAHAAEAQPSGARSDHRHSAPGTMIPGGPEPAAASGEWERIQRAAKGRPGGGERPHRGGDDARK